LWYDWDHDAKGNRIYGAQRMFDLVVGNWCNEAKWDPATRQVLYTGIGHYAAMKFIAYSADRNEWTLMPVPPWADPRFIECKVADVRPEDRVVLSAGRKQGTWKDAVLYLYRDGKRIARVRTVELGETESVATVLEKTSEIKTGDTARSPTDSTVRLGNPKGPGRSWGRGHTYDCQAILPGKRLYAISLWKHMRLYDIDRQDWIKSVPGFKGNSPGAAEGFPEMNGFVAFSRPKRLCLFNPTTGEKRDLGPVGFGMHGIMEYNPVHKVVVVGGGDGNKRVGNRGLWLVDVTGKIKRLKPAPVRLSCRPQYKFTCDPVSGEYVVVGTTPDGKLKTYAYHPILDEWREIPGFQPPSGVAIPIDTYGVILYLAKPKGGPFSCHLYRHKPVFTEAGKPEAAPGKPQ
jgi:hypothetical protein